MSSLVFEKLAQTLAAGQEWPLSIGGDFFRVEAADWPVTVALVRGGREVGRMSNVRAGDYVREVDFDAVKIINGATAQAVTVQIAGGGVGSDRVIGEVSVIDGGKARVLAGTAFVGLMSQAALAGNYALVELWNPAASGKRVVVEQVICASSVGTGFLHAQYAAALTTLAASGASKLLGGAGSAAELRKQSSVSGLGAAMLLTNGAANTSNTFVPREPMVLLPGQGYVVWAQGLNQDVSASWEWFEESL